MKNGFTYLEMVVSVAIITILAIVVTLLIKPHVSKAKDSTFIDDANTIVNAAISKYANDEMESDDGYPDDIYIHDKNNDEFVGRVCYSLKSLKLKNINDNYQGSVEICTASHCDYKTRIWLSNDKYYIDGAKDEIKKKDFKNHVLGINRCGINF